MQYTDRATSRQCNLQIMQSPDRAISRPCNLQIVQSPDGAISRWCNLQLVQSPESAISRLCNLQIVQSSEIATTDIVISGSSQLQSNFPRGSRTFGWSMVSCMFPARLVDLSHVPARLADVPHVSHICPARVRVWGVPLFVGLSKLCYL